MRTLSTPAFEDLGSLFSSEHANLFGFLLVRCGSRAVAEDLTGQTFEAAMAKFAVGDGREVTAAWLRTVARRRLVDYWRAEGARRRRHEKLARLYEPAERPPVDPDTDVDMALDSLSGKQRAALMLRYCDDFSVTEVADVFGLSYKAAESLLSRARRNFSDAYRANIEGGPR